MLWNWNFKLDCSNFALVHQVGNNREVARLYSERLGYTVNESTVRGIKKRYLEVVHHPGSFRPPLFTFQTLCFFFILIIHFNFHFYFHFPIFIVPSPLQGVHKGKISSPGVSPRASGGDENSREAGDREFYLWSWKEQQDGIWCKKNKMALM